MRGLDDDNFLGYQFTVLEFVALQRHETLDKTLSRNGNALLGLRKQPESLGRNSGLT